MRFFMAIIGMIITMEGAMAVDSNYKHATFAGGVLLVYGIAV